MSGYLEVKSNLYLKPFRSWKRQWCILRPSPTRAGSGCLAVYSSEAGSAAGSIEFPPGSTVRRTTSRSRPHAFAVYSSEQLCKPIILLAANSDNDAHIWMKKIKALFTEENPYFGLDTLKDTYSITLISTDLSRKCGLTAGDGFVSVSLKSIILAQSDNKQFTTVLPWKNIKDIKFSEEQGADRDCTLVIDSTFDRGAGEVTFQRANSSLTAAILASRPRAIRSEGDLRTSEHTSPHKRVARSSSWYNAPSDVSMDDIDLAMSKEAQVIPTGQLSRSVRAPHLPLDDSDRRSLQSVSSGIYEEILDLPFPLGDTVDGLTIPVARPPEEPAYECVSEVRPPPLPPRLPLSSKLGDSWSSSMSDSPTEVTRHSSTGSLPRCRPNNDFAKHTNTLPSKSRQAFNAFRKRLKSESTASVHPKPDAKENKHALTKKKRFDFAPSKDLFRNFRGKKHSKKVTAGLAKIGETKSCEFLDETEHVTSNRCSKSVEGLDEALSEGSEAEEALDASLSLPSDIVELILCGRERLAEIRLRTRGLAESHYLPMSPAPAAPPDPHYTVMSPRTNLATL